MATRHSITRFERSQRGDSRIIRDGLSGRTIYFPPDFLAQHDQRPGQLVEVLTLALSAYLADEKGGASC